MGDGWGSPPYLCRSELSSAFELRTPGWGRLPQVRRPRSVSLRLLSGKGPWEHELRSSSRAPLLTYLGGLLGLFWTCPLSDGTTFSGAVGPCQRAQPRR